MIELTHSVLDLSNKVLTMASRQGDSSSSSSGSGKEAPMPKQRTKKPLDDTRNNRDNTQRLAEEELLDAAFDGNFETVKILLREGISTEVISRKPGKEGLTPLLLASWSGQERVVRLLLLCQAKRKAVGQGMRAVHFAARGGHVGVLSILWDAECSIKCRSATGQSPLHLAADNGNMPTVKWLVEKGSYVTTKDINGKTAEDLAKESGHRDVAKYLHEKAEELRMDGIVGERKLGEGAFGEVFLVKKNDRYFVLKKINLSELERRKQEYAHQEIKLLKSLTHPYIVSYLGGGFKGRHLYIKMEYCSGGDLYSRICEQKDKLIQFEEKQVVNWCLRICLALKYIHNRNILHRDIKPHNIFLTGNGVIKLGDFGLAKALEGCSVASTSLGSPAYMSPEVMEGNPYDSGADMWSFGCLMFELAALRMAFPYKDLELSSAFSQNFRDAIKSLFNDELRRRPKAADLLRLPIFQDALEAGLEEKENQVSELNQEIEDLCDEILDLREETKKHQDVIKKMESQRESVPNTPKKLSGIGFEYILEKHKSQSNT